MANKKSPTISIFSQFNEVTLLKTLWGLHSLKTVTERLPTKANCFHEYVALSFPNVATFMRSPTAFPVLPHLSSAVDVRYHKKDWKEFVEPLRRRWLVAQMWPQTGGASAATWGLPRTPSWTSSAPLLPCYLRTPKTSQIFLIILNAVLVDRRVPWRLNICSIVLVLPKAHVLSPPFHWEPNISDRTIMIFDRLGNDIQWPLPN